MPLVGVRHRRARRRDRPEDGGRRAHPRAVRRGGEFETWDDAGRTLRPDHVRAGLALDRPGGRGDEKAARLLNPGGTLALFWNRDCFDDDVQRRPRPVYAEHAPSSRGHDRGHTATSRSSPHLRETGRFASVDDPHLQMVDDGDDRRARRPQRHLQRPSRLPAEQRERRCSRAMRERDRRARRDASTCTSRRTRSSRGRRRLTAWRRAIDHASPRSPSSSACRSTASTSTCATASSSRSRDGDGGPRGVPAAVRPGRCGRQVAAVGDHPAARRPLRRRGDRRLAVPRRRHVARRRRSMRCARTAAPRSSGAPRSPVTDATALSHLTYLAILAACLIGTAPLELVLHVGVYAQWRRLLADTRAGRRRVRRLGPLRDPAGRWSYDRAVPRRADAARAAAARGTAVLRRHPDLRGAHLRGRASRRAAGLAKP